MEEDTSFERPLTFTTRNVGESSLVKIKLLHRRSAIKLEKAKIEIAALKGIFNAITQFNASEISTFDLLSQISQHIRLFPEGNLKDRHAQIKWKYLIQLRRSLLVIKAERPLLCDLIVKNDLPVLVRIFEGLQAEVVKQVQELEMTNARIACQIDTIFPALRKKHQELKAEVTAMQTLSGFVESISMLQMNVGTKTKSFNKKIEELRKFCVENKGDSYINSFYRQVFSEDGQISLEKIIGCKQEIKFYILRLEAELTSVKYGMNLIKNNDDPKIVYIRILSEIRQKIKGLMESLPLKKMLEIPSRSYLI